MKLTIRMRNAGIDAIVPQANGGRVDFLGGPVPDPDGAILAGSQVLFSVPIPAGAFGPAVNAQSSMAGLPAIIVVQADGQVTYARTYDGAGRPLWDAYPSVDFTIDSLVVVAGGTVKLNTFIYRKPA